MWRDVVVSERVIGGTREIGANDKTIRKMKNHPKLTVTVKVIPHPNPRQAIDLVANLFLKNFSNEMEQAETMAASEKIG